MTRFVGSASQSFDFGVDIGTSKISICERQAGQILSEPSYIAMSPRRSGNDHIVAVGSEAEAMLGKVSEKIKVESPMANGVIIDSSLAFHLVKHLALKAGVHTGIRKCNVLVGALLGVNDTERRSFEQAGKGLGRAHVVSVSEPVAAFFSSGIFDWQSNRASLIVDVGSGATEVLVMSGRTPILGGSIRIGGDCLDLHLIKFLKKKAGILVSRAEARAAKEALSSAGTGAEVQLRGVQCNSRLPGKATLAFDDFLTVQAPFHFQITQLVRNVLARTSPDLSADLLDGCGFLCGGSSKLPGLFDLLERETGLLFQNSKNPEAGVIKGLEKMVNCFSRWKNTSQIFRHLSPDSVFA